MKLYQQLIIILVLVSCSLAQANNGRYPIRAFQVAPTQDVTAFNKHLKVVATQHPSAKSSPLALLKRLPVEPAGHTKAYHWCGKVKAGQQVCTFREENIPNHSVVGVIQKITFKATRNGWYAASIQRAWRCQPGKGESKFYQTHLCD